LNCGTASAIDGRSSSVCLDGKATVCPHFDPPFVDRPTVNSDLTELARWISPINGIAATVTIKVGIARVKASPESTHAKTVCSLANPIENACTNDAAGRLSASDPANSTSST